MITHTKHQLKQAGIVSYEIEAEVLLMHVLGVERVNLYLNCPEVTEGQKRKLDALIKRRIAREPLQYILGKTEFYGLEFFVEPGVFIPRPETEVLVESVIRHCEEPCRRVPRSQRRKRFGEGGRQGDEAISLLQGDCFGRLRRPRNDGISILDLCTGSGCIAISLAKHIKCGKIIANDISAKSLEIARKNAILNDVEGKISFKNTDLFKDIKGKTCPELGEGYDIITCNPPYIKRQDLKNLPVEVSCDPEIALDGGEDGLDFYRAIARHAPEYLKAGGIFALELGDGHAKDVKNMFTGKTEIINDLNGIERVLIWIK